MAFIEDTVDGVRGQWQHQNGEWVFSPHPARSLYDRDLVSTCRSAVRAARAVARWGDHTSDDALRCWVRALEALIRWAHV